VTHLVATLTKSITTIPQLPVTSTTSQISSLLPSLALPFIAPIPTVPPAPPYNVPLTHNHSPGHCPTQSPSSTSTLDEATMAPSAQLPKVPNPYPKPSNLPNIQSKPHHSHQFMTEPPCREKLLSTITHNPCLTSTPCSTSPTIHSPFHQFLFMF